MRTLLTKEQLVELDALIALREGTIEVPSELVQRCYIFDVAYNYIVSASKRRWWINEKETLIGLIETSDMPEDDLDILRNFASPKGLDKFKERWPWFRVHSFKDRMHEDRVIECAYRNIPANKFLRAQAFMRTLSGIVERNCINFGNSIHTRATPSDAFRKLVGKISIIQEDQRELYRVENQMTREDLELMLELREIKTYTLGGENEVVIYGFERDEPYSEPHIETDDYYTISISRKRETSHDIRKTGGCFFKPRK